jgi:hypothetical protein
VCAGISCGEDLLLDPGLDVKSVTHNLKESHRVHFGNCWLINNFHNDL